MKTILIGILFCSPCWAETRAEKLQAELEVFCPRFDAYLKTIRAVEAEKKEADYNWNKFGILDYSRYNEAVVGLANWKRVLPRRLRRIEKLSNGPVDLTVLCTDRLMALPLTGTVVR